MAGCNDRPWSGAGSWCSRHLTPSKIHRRASKGGAPNAPLFVRHPSDRARAKHPNHPRTHGTSRSEHHDDLHPCVTLRPLGSTAKPTFFSLRNGVIRSRQNRLLLRWLTSRAAAPTALSYSKLPQPLALYSSQRMVSSSSVGQPVQRSKDRKNEAKSIRNFARSFFMGGLTHFGLF